MDFYRTPLLERAHHEGYWQWKAGGSVGHKLGVVGSSMMVLMLLYSIRKRVGALRRLGPLGRWLDVHIYLGIFGPLLVVLHSSFKVQGLVALSFWSMVIVASSGVLGRYLYMQIPRTRAGEERPWWSSRRKTASSPASSARASASTRPRSPGSTRSWRSQLESAFSAASSGSSRTTCDCGRGCAPSRRAVGRSRRRSSADFERVVRQKAQVHRRILLWDRVHELFHYWHVLHKPFAVVMYLFMIVHVAVALVTGYGWVGRS